MHITGYLHTVCLRHGQAFGHHVRHHVLHAHTRCCFAHHLSHNLSIRQLGNGRDGVRHRHTVLDLNHIQVVLAKHAQQQFLIEITGIVNIDFNADDYLPLDTKSANFDNIADVQTLSPTLLDAYLTAASAVSLTAIGDRKSPATQSVYKISGFDDSNCFKAWLLCGFLLKAPLMLGLRLQTPDID